MIQSDVKVKGYMDNIILSIVCLGIIRNSIKNPLFTGAMIILYFITLEYELASIILNCGVLLRFVINYTGRDFIHYIEMSNGLIPIESLFILSFSMCILLYIGFRKKSNNWLIKYLPYILLANTSMRYMSMGVLRNIIAFALWNMSEYYIFIIPLFHPSSFVYFMVYYLKDIRRYKFRWIHVLIGVIVSYGLVVLGVPSNIYRVMRYITKWGYFSRNWWSFGNWNYYILVSTTALIVYWKNHKHITIWMVIYCFMFVYIYHYKFMIRMVYISFFSLVNILIRLDETPFNRKYLLWLSLYFLTSVVP